MFPLAILQEIFSRYMEQSHPVTSTLVPLYFPEEPLRSFNAISPTTEFASPKSVSESKPSPLSLSSVKEQTKSPNIPPEQQKDSQHSWACVPIYPGLSHEELLKENYPVLKRYIRRPSRASCGIFVHESQEDDILFFNRLAKILSQKLFPSRLVLFHQKILADFSSSPHPFCLAPLPVIRYKNSQIKYHSPILQDKITCIPIYSSSQYAKDSELKRDLWTLLTHLSASMQKS